ncbi:MAG: hypothetical protein ACR2QC_12275 [Gammaproteobacteria bacterium]
MKLKTLFLTIAAAVFALSGGVAMAFDAERGDSTFGLGGDSCPEFLRKEKESEIGKIAYEVWVGGFMTGFMSAAWRYNDTQQTFDFAEDIDVIMHLIREYCDKYPIDGVVLAAEYVVNEHFLLKAGER